MTRPSPSAIKEQRCRPRRRVPSPCGQCRVGSRVVKPEGKKKKKASCFQRNSPNVLLRRSGAKELTADLLGRCRRVVPPGQRPLPVAAGGPGLQEAGERRGHAGALQQLRLDHALPPPVQRHGEELEAVPPGRQHLGECPPHPLPPQPFGVACRWFLSWSERVTRREAEGDSKVYVCVLKCEWWLWLRSVLVSLGKTLNPQLLEIQFKVSLEIKKK